MGLQTTVLALLLAGLPLSTAAQGLGDAAAQEKQRRAKAGAKTAGKVVTEKDLDKYAGEKPQESEQTGSPTAAPESPQDAAELPAVVTPPRTPDSESGREPDADSHKKARAAEYKKRLAEAETMVADAEKRLAEAEERWRVVGNHTASLSEAEPERGRVEQARRAAEEARRHRDALADGARREGIPPGWLR
jgi:hypothetical protein